MEDWQEVFREQMWEAKPGDAWSLRSRAHLHARNLASGWKKAVQEHACASFTCSQCNHTWSSHQVTVLFHVHWERAARKGQVRMRLFRQQCHRCSSTQKEKPQFTREAVESVVQGLVLDIREKCYRERVHRSELLEVVCESTGPHKSEFCEACQMGLHKGHHGKSDGALHHGKPGSALYCGSPRSPRYSRIPNLYRYDDVSPIHTSRRGRVIQPPWASPAATASCPCCICCVGFSVACVVFVLVAYWRGWF